MFCSWWVCYTMCNPLHQYNFLTSMSLVFCLCPCQFPCLHLVQAFLFPKQMSSVSLLPASAAATSLSLSLSLPSLPFWKLIFTIVNERVKECHAYYFISFLTQFYSRAIISNYNCQSGPFSKITALSHYLWQTSYHRLVIWSPFYCIWILLYSYLF